jgi:uncharacterized protein (TIGR02270 family)
MENQSVGREVQPAIITEHAEEASFLWLQRAFAVNAPNYSPKQFADLDERLEAHIDGLRVAGDEGWKIVEQGLDNEGPEDFFAAGVLAIEAKDGRFDALIDRAKGLPEVVPGLISALGWVSWQVIEERVKSLLDDTLPLKQKLGIAAFAMHRKDPGPALDRCLSSPMDSVRIRAFRAAGELGRMNIIPQIKAALTEGKPEVLFRAAWSGVLLGDRSRALDTLAGIALKTGPRRSEALQLVLLAMDVNAGHALLLQTDDLPDAVRIRIIGSGLIGDPSDIPWIIEQMSHPQTARVAAEAFVNITGADFNLDQLEAMPPEDFEEGPSEDPDDENVELPEDIALPWPDIEKIKQWWSANHRNFQPGKRFSLGNPVTSEHCLQIIKEGHQRGRVLAALHLSLLQPGSVLFPTSAPARRQ